MADKEVFPINLYDSNGAQVGTAEHDEDLLDPSMREHLLESGGKTYKWDQRNGRWTQVADTIKLGKAEAVQPGGSTPTHAKP